VIQQLADHVEDVGGRVTIEEQDTDEMDVE
jgi:hypothetical protein